MKRYDFLRGGIKIQVDDGDWVKWEDVEALQAKYDGLNTALTSALTLMEILQAENDELKWRVDNNGLHEM